MQELTNKIAILGSLNKVEDGLLFCGAVEDNIQVGLFKYNTGKIMRDHKHISRPRILDKTQEILLVWKGSCECRVYCEANKLQHTGIMKSGDFIILYNGGVGYTILEDNTILMEVKAGSYIVKSDDEDRVLL